MQKEPPGTKYWVDSSEKDFLVAQDLFNLRHYPQCLFFCHLSLEKLLKAFVIKTIKDYPSYTHDLRKLAEIAKIDSTLSQKQILDKISTFNIASRYADKKYEFYKRYNRKEYAQKYLKITKNLILWLKKEFQKKSKK